MKYEINQAISIEAQILSHLALMKRAADAVNEGLMSKEQFVKEIDPQIKHLEDLFEALGDPKLKSEIDGYVSKTRELVDGIRAML